MPPLWAGTPVPLLLGLGLAVAASLGLHARGWLPRLAVRVVAVTAGHGSLLATALGWAAVESAPRWDPRPAMVAILGLLALAAAAAGLGEPGALAYLTIPAWLGVVACRGRLGGLGLAGPIPVAAVLLGLAVGAALGGHLLVSASRTAGYHLRGGFDTYLAALAYDVGANVPSSECFFRGALFNRLQRRRSFALGAAAAAGASLLRYLGDPLLPKAVEVLVGAALYVPLLGLANAWLFWRAGSLWPCLASALAFFAAYRLLAVG